MERHSVEEKEEGGPQPKSVTAFTGDLVIIKQSSKPSNIGQQRFGRPMAGAVVSSEPNRDMCDLLMVEALQARSEGRGGIGWVREQNHSSGDTEPAAGNR